MPELTRAQQNLLAAADDIWSTPPDARDAAFLARQLVQATLPHRSPGNIPIWSRTNGNLTLGIQPAYDARSGKCVGYPFGTIPRLLLFWMNTEALRTGSRKLILGDSLAGFMRQLGLNPDNGSRGAKRSDAARLKDQMHRLFRAKISFEYDLTRNNSNGTGWLDMQVAPRAELWWDHHNPYQADIWESWIELGEDFYSAITASPVPVDIRALKALKGSALALDLYSWLTYTAHRTHQNNTPRFVPWGALHAQFGADYAETRNFQQACKKALLKIHQVYPDLVLGDTRGGIEVLPASLPAVASAR